jgi:hypothetical protein
LRLALVVGPQVKPKGLVRWVHGGQVIVLYLLENGQEIAALPVVKGKAKICLPAGLGVIVKDVTTAYTDGERVSA